MLSPTCFLGCHWTSTSASRASGPKGHAVPTWPFSTRSSIFLEAQMPLWAQALTITSCSRGGKNVCRICSPVILGLWLLNISPELVHSFSLTSYCSLTSSPTLDNPPPTYTQSAPCFLLLTASSISTFSSLYVVFPIILCFSLYKSSPITPPCQKYHLFLSNSLPLYLSQKMTIWLSPKMMQTHFNLEHS